MRERPILFSGPMVRAILAGKKTQTRRVVKPRKDHYLGCDLAACELAGEVNSGDYRNALCAPGDRLWVREAWDFLPDSGPDEPNAAFIRYWAGGDMERRLVPDGFNPLLYGHEKVRPSIHMPRWASRITLEVTEVRAERLRDISEADAKAEGVDMDKPITMPMASNVPTVTVTMRPRNAVEAYAALWESINGPGSWAENPWVWCVSFRRAA